MKKVFISLILGFGFCSWFQNHLIMSQVPKKDDKMAKMECNLILPKKTVRIGDLVVLGEVEIKNISKKDITIIYNSDPFEHFDLVVFDPKGKKISRDGYGGIFSPYSPKPEKKLILGPGDKYKSSVSIFGTSEEEDLKSPGIYKITAIYEYEKEKAVSKQVELTVVEK